MNIKIKRLTDAGQSIRKLYKKCCNSMKGSKAILAVIESVVHGQLKMDFIILHGCFRGKTS